jgi:hypothetical protein
MTLAPSTSTLNHITFLFIPSSVRPAAPFLEPINSLYTRRKNFSLVQERCCQTDGRRDTAASKTAGRISLQGIALIGLGTKHEVSCFMLLEDIAFIFKVRKS